MTTSLAPIDFSGPVYGIPQAEKERELLLALNALTRFHAERCPPYARLLKSLGQGQGVAEKLADIPFLPVELFKSHNIASVETSEVKINMTSSGTTGAVSKIAVDGDTASLQSKGLTATMVSILGQARRPMLIADTPEVVRDPRLLTARGAGVLGMMRYGRNHVFALNPDLTANHDAIAAFAQANAGQPTMIFGFTFMAWTALIDAVGNAQYDLSGATLVHSGGWKKLQDRAVSNEVFRETMRTRHGITDIYNFYGMVEQMGTLHLEGPNGLLSPPRFSDIIIRDPRTLLPVEDGTPGIIQTLSLIPRSYPGHSLLTGDLGVIEAVDTGLDGRMGKGFRVLGRLPKAELRGCSDVYASPNTKAA
jgi:hypothetical protein